jgi:glycosyltransferase involved in cell wall biosynthesis
MRIGIMLRAFDEHGGIGVYTRNIVNELLAFDSTNEYILFFRNPSNMGRFAEWEHVEEHLITAPTKVMWDQIAIPIAARRARVDVLFHPKFTVPFLVHCPVVMTVHGADWFIPEQAQYYHPLDVAYIRMVMPYYFKKCTTVISVSQLTTDNFHRVLSLPNGKVRTVYFAPARHFRRIEDQAALESIRSRYSLPQRFILTLSKRAGDERKNLSQIFQAYAAYHKRTANPAKLVIGGKDCHLFREEYGLAQHRYGQDILFPGWLDQADLPAIYSLAELFLYPSNLEAFPIPITEAMACGTPIITSNVNGLEEIAGDAALLVAPQDTEEIAAALERLLAEPQLRKSLSRKGLDRAKYFTWDHCTVQTLTILEEAGCSR